MAAKLYPQGMTLHSIGYAALKYPELPPELPIPLGNQLGVLQRTPLPIQIRIMAHVASQYLPALLEYQYSDAPHLHDPTSSQYWCSDAFTLINWLTSNPDAAVAVAKHPSLFADTFSKLLNPNILTEMKACTRVGGASFEADFASMLQFVSTILLRKEHLPSPPHPQLQDLVPKLKAWKRKYGGQFIGRVSDRLADQIKSPDNADFAMVMSAQNQNLVCGFVGCEEKMNLNACARCKMQRYCRQAHQKSDWGFIRKYVRRG
ncbi:hypothetical protein LSUB1_G007670 [Lachnellula subtilissima]|uniref:MYND-type domain-containing protein n=1 Tax=Lachnellula subtilissima TaxID=602034 RepID=A0A8H8U6S4_9HELO|nr:hypothetical protein LSUB1_G007670 [Lachnellula subtilissima]